MVRSKRLIGAAVGAAMIIGIVALAMWIGPSWHTTSAQDGLRPVGPLIARGYTDAPAGTVVVAGNPAGGATLLELRIKEGQTVKRDEIIAVLSGYPQADIAVRTAEASLEKLKRIRETMTTGTHVTQIAMEEALIKTTIDNNRLQVLELKRSAMPNDQKEMQLDLAERALQSQKDALHLQKQSLAAALAATEIDIAQSEASLENARSTREDSLVRSPLDGVVVQIFARQGEGVSGVGIAKIVDMRQLRVLADVDELHLDRLVPGAKVEITFRGSPTVYKGRVSRAPSLVKRLKRSQADMGDGSVHLVEVEIEFDDPASIPQMLGHETRVVFL
jgi:HlyD family secretion protein